MNALSKHLICISCLIYYGCASPLQTKDQVIVAAESIRDFPLPRSEVIERFNLSAIDSQILAGRRKGNYRTFTEIWNHPSGITILAYYNLKRDPSLITSSIRKDELENIDTSTLEYEHVNIRIHSIEVRAGGGQPLHRSTSSAKNS